MSIDRRVLGRSKSQQRAPLEGSARNRRRQGGGTTTFTVPRGVFSAAEQVYGTTIIVGNDPSRD
jgi:hypothetical protein